MRILKLAVATLFLAASFAAKADYIPASWSESRDFNVDFSWELDSFTFSHDLTTDGFRPLTDFIFEFVLNIDLVDDFHSSREAAVRIDLPGLYGDRTFFDLSGDEFGGWSLLGLIELNVLGTLTITVDRLWGDFSLQGSQLTGYGLQAVAVPEPGTLTLFGAALLGLGLARRRRQKA